jgi:hypothetical protein
VDRRGGRARARWHRRAAGAVAPHPRRLPPPPTTARARVGAAKCNERTMGPAHVENVADLAHRTALACHGLPRLDGGSRSPHSTLTPRACREPAGHPCRRRGPQPVTRTRSAGGMSLSQSASSARLGVCPSVSEPARCLAACRSVSELIPGTDAFASVGAPDAARDSQPGIRRRADGAAAARAGSSSPPGARDSRTHRLDRRGAGQSSSGPRLSLHSIVCSGPIRVVAARQAATAREFRLVLRSVVRSRGD